MLKYVVVVVGMGIVVGLVVGLGLVVLEFGWKFRRLIASWLI